jgi:hypothetical protein
MSCCKYGGNRYQVQSLHKDTHLGVSWYVELKLLPSSGMVKLLSL